VLLRALDALLDTHSVTRAAERLGLSQPAVSGMLVRLREVFGDPLFVRAQRGLLPTARAEALAVPVRNVLREIEDLLLPGRFDPASTAMTIHIAATDYAQRVIILPFLIGLRRDAPGVRVSVRPVETGELAGQLERGVLDIALVTPEMAPDHLRARTLFREDYVCVMRARHPAVSEGALDLDSFCALDHAIMSHDGSQFRGATDLALADIGRTRRVVASVPSFTFLIDVLRHSDLCALLPRRLVSEEEGLILLPPPLPVAGFTKIAVWHERSHGDQAMTWLRCRLAEAAPR